MKKFITFTITLVMAIMVMAVPTTMANAAETGAVISADFVPERPVGYARESYRLVIHGEVMPIEFKGPFDVYNAIRHEGLNGTPLTAILIEETYGVSEDSTGFGSAICRYPVDSFCKKWGYELPLVLTCNASSLKFFVGDIAYTGAEYETLDDVYEAVLEMLESGKWLSSQIVIGVGINSKQCTKPLEGYGMEEFFRIYGIEAPHVYLKGDANDDGRITVADAVLIERALLGMDVQVHPQTVDVNGDGVFNVFDMVAIRQLLLEIMG